MTFTPLVPIAMESLFTFLSTTRMARCLTAMTAGVVGLDSVGFERSAEALVMLVLGGTGNLWGALTGAVLFQLFEHIVSAANPFHWMTLVGLLLILIVVFVPRGIFYGVSIAWSRSRPPRAPR